MSNELQPNKVVLLVAAISRLVAGGRRQKCLSLVVANSLNVATSPRGKLPDPHRKVPMR